MPDPTAQTSSLEDILFRDGLLNADQLSAIRLESINSGQPIEKILIRYQIPVDKIIQAKAQTLNVPYIRLEGKAIASDVLNLVPESAARRYRIIPFEKKGEELLVAMADPLDIQIIQFVEKRAGLRVRPYLAQAEDILKSISDQYSQNLTSDVTSALKEVASVRTDEDIQKVSETLHEAPVSNIIDQLLEYAIKSRASDIHIEPQEDHTRVRYRIDGILQEKILLPKGVHDALVSRIKILSVLKIDEKRLPQDGRFTFTYGKNIVDLRISTVPTIFGEKVVMRLLPKSSGAPSLLELGLRGSSLKSLEVQLLRPHGIILVCGPTGSGKTTTLYSILSKISTSKVNIVTVEDPVEYQVPGVNQVQVNTQVGLTFASALRSFLRQDPNIIMVGEIRDTETADLAIQAALTGHQVFSTIHTNSSSGAPPRLLDMGVEPFLLTSALNAVVGQRVVRKICSHCKVEFSVPPEMVENIKAVLGKILPQAQRQDSAIRLFKGKGCALCGNTGYMGRIGIFEALVISEEIAKLILEHAASGAIEQASIAAGMVTMKQDGYLKALEGVTTMEEVLRVAQD